VEGGPDPIEVAVRALRHRDRSRRQVEERLARAGVGEDRRARALETLEHVGYLDDGRFAAGRAAALVARGHGDAAIAHLLEADGIAAEVVQDVLAALEPEVDRARRELAGGREPRRCAARLLRKGFAPESVEEALGGGFAVEVEEA
jgi:regulatory protein